MYKDVELISTQEHQNHAIKAMQNFSYAKEQISAPLTIAEFYESCKDYPIIFLKDATNKWSASAVLGYSQNKNLHVDENGMWERGKYIPASVRRYPFIFVAQENQELTLAVDKHALSQADEDKERKLFTDEGKPSEFIDGVLKFMNQLQRDALATSSFIAQLDKWELLEEKSAQIITPDKKSHQLNGFYIINEEKLKHLSKKKKEEMCDKNAYSLITAHLISLSNIERMSLK